MLTDCCGWKPGELEGMNWAVFRAECQSWMDEWSCLCVVFCFFPYFGFRPVGTPLARRQRYVAGDLLLIGSKWYGTRQMVRRRMVPKNVNQI